MQGIFQVLAFPIDRLHVRYNSQIYELPDEMAKKSQQFWKTVAGPHIYNGTLARLKAWKCTDGKLEIDLELTQYRTQLYSNQHVEHIIKYWGEKSLSRAMGISAVVETSEHMVVMMKRSHQVGEFPGHYDVFGGHVEVSQEGDPLPDVFDAIRAELVEELGLHPRDMNVQPLGLVESIPNRKPELVFHCKVLLSFEQVLQQAEKAVDRFEYDEIVQIPYPYDGCEPLSPSAAGCLSLFKSKRQKEGQGGKRRNSTGRRRAKT